MQNEAPCHLQPSVEKMTCFMYTGIGKFSSSKITKVQFACIADCERAIKMYVNNYINWIIEISYERVQLAILM